MSLRARPSSKPKSPRLNWSARLARIVRTGDGKTLRTRSDARAYALALPHFIQQHNAWQHLCRLLLEGAPAEAVTHQLELALLLTGRLKMGT